MVHSSIVKRRQQINFFVKKANLKSNKNNMLILIHHIHFLMNMITPLHFSGIINGHIVNGYSSMMNKQVVVEKLTNCSIIA